MSRSKQRTPHGGVISPLKADWCILFAALRRQKMKILGLIIAAAILLGTLSTIACNKQEGPVREAISHKDDYQQAYIYGFPMIAAYKAMYQFAVDKSNSQYKAPF